MIVFNALIVACGLSCMSSRGFVPLASLAACKILNLGVLACKDYEATHLCGKGKDHLKEMVGQQSSEKKASCA